MSLYIVDCECLTAGLSDEWVEEFHDVTDGDLVNQTDFWSNLEQSWREMAEENKETAAHPWLDEFEKDHFFSQYEKYQFQEASEGMSAENCLEQGKKKLAEGDLPSAVLYFEAAVKQNPEAASAWHLLGSSQVSSFCLLDKKLV